VKDFGTRAKLVTVLFAVTTMLGCGGLNAGTPSAQSASGLVATSAIVDFGNVPVGTSAVRTNTVTNTTKSPIVLTRTQADTSDFKITGQSLPLTLAPGQHTVLQIMYSPQNGGSALSKVLLTSNVLRWSNVFTLRGTAVLAGRIRLTPSQISFGNVSVGKTQTQSATLSNTGKTPVQITRASISGEGFTLTGLSLPMTLQAGQNATVGVIFKPASGSTSTGMISVVGTISLNLSRRPATFGGRAPEPVALNTVSTTVTAPVSGVGTVASAGTGQLVVSPTSLALGRVKIGTTMAQSATLINSGTADVTIRQATVNGRGFKVSGISFPLTLSAGQRKSFSVIFAPQSAGSATGSIAVTTDTSNAVSLPVSGVAVANPASAGVLSTSDSSLDFGSVAINATANQSETLTNSGGSSVTITQANVSGNGFSATGLALPLTLAPGQSFTFGAAFTPKSGGNAAGSISVVSDASDSTINITLAGTGAVSGQLAVSPGALNFGNVTVGQTKSLTGSITATGSTITVSAAGMSTSEFTISGLSLPVTLAAGKSASFTVTFKPQSSGAASATGSFTSNASNPSAQQSLTGSGAAAPQHSVALTWNPSPSTVVGYNVYRGTTTGGPYSQITTMNADTSYVDSSVQSGQTYFYVTRAVDGAGKESANSNQTQAAIPTP
jgi:Abnormal spindle-like microcephaly-assoc'd, ASPM-SPD-2-Hydin